MCVQKYRTYENIQSNGEISKYLKLKLLLLGHYITQSGRDQLHFYSLWMSTVKLGIVQYPVSLANTLFIVYASMVTMTVLSINAPLTPLISETGPLSRPASPRPPSSPLSLAIFSSLTSRHHHFRKVGIGIQNFEPASAVCLEVGGFLRGIVCVY